MRRVARQFIDRGLVPDAARPQFDEAIASTIRLRNSVAAELLLLALVYIVGVGFVWRTQVALDLPSWYGVPAGWEIAAIAGRLVARPASVCPLFQFLLLRWYFRLFVWARFLWKVSRIDLQFLPANPDRSGGLGLSRHDQLRIRAGACWLRARCWPG